MRSVEIAFMTIAFLGRGERKLKLVRSKIVHYGTFGLEQLLPQVKRLNSVTTTHPVDRRTKVFRMPLGYLCFMCGFGGTDCQVCLCTDILPIPCGELDGLLDSGGTSDEEMG